MNFILFLPPNGWWNSTPEPGAVYITVLKYGALSWEDKSETPTNTSGRVAFTHPTKNGCLVTTALHRTNLSRKASYRPLRTYRTPLATLHSPIQGAPVGVHDVVGGVVSFFVSFAPNVWHARSEHGTNRGTHS